ncbi:MAG: L,D-transpeptidase family protein [Propionibacteriaceae bacterium]|nr:L,D-transpeptidase family protein [Propionibacteriaceae bacterium]
MPESGVDGESTSDVSSIEAPAVVPESNHDVARGTDGLEPVDAENVGGATRPSLGADGQIDSPGAADLTGESQGVRPLVGAESLGEATPATPDDVASNPGSTGNDSVESNGAPLEAYVVDTQSPNEPLGNPEHIAVAEEPATPSELVGADQSMSVAATQKDTTIPQPGIVRPDDPQATIQQPETPQVESQGASGASDQTVREAVVVAGTDSADESEVESVSPVVGVPADDVSMISQTKEAMTTPESSTPTDPVTPTIDDANPPWENVVGFVPAAPDQSTQPGGAPNSSRTQPGQASVIAPVAPKQPAGKNRWASAVMTTVVGVVTAVVLVGGTGAVGAAYFESHAKPGTQLAGRDVSGFSAAQVHDVAVTLADNYSVDLRLGERTATGSADELGLTFDVAQTVTNVMAAGGGEAVMERYSPFKPKNVPLAMAIDQERLQNYLNETFVADDQRSVPAGAAYDADQQKFVVVAAKPGAQADVAAATQALAEGQGFGQTLEIPTVPEEPAITDATAQKTVDTANQQLAKPVVLTGAGEDITVEPSQVASWTVFSQDLEAGTINRDVDQAKLSTDVDAILTEHFTKQTESRQVMMSPSGATLGVKREGHDGTTVVDPAKVKAGIASAMMTDQSGTVTVDVATQPHTSENVPMDPEYLTAGGAKWVEVNRSNFTVTRWEGTTNLGTWSVVIGRPATPTYTGIFKVYWKLEKQTMRGEGYEQEDVPWIAYFNGDIGLHGNYWVTQMGQAASHGCVGIPVAQAKVMYDWIEYGTMVVVHD